MKFYLSFLVLLMSYSCASTECLEFRHKKLLIYNDEIIIKISPIKNKNLAKIDVKYYNPIIESAKPKGLRILSNDKVSYTKKIHLKDYIEIINTLNQINQEDLNYPKTFVDSSGSSYVQFSGFDGGINSISYKKGRLRLNFSTQGLVKDLHRNFYETIELIIKHTDIDFEKIN